MLQIMEQGKTKQNNNSKTKYKTKQKTRGKSISEGGKIIRLRQMFLRLLMGKKDFFLFSRQILKTITIST